MRFGHILTIKSIIKIALIAMLSVFLIAVSFFNYGFMQALSISISILIWSVISIISCLKASNLLMRISFICHLSFFLKSFYYFFWILYIHLAFNGISFETLDIIRQAISFAFLLTLTIMSLVDIVKCKEPIKERDHVIFIKIAGAMIIESILYFAYESLLPTKVIGDGSIIASSILNIFLFFTLGYIAIPVILWIVVMIFEIRFLIVNKINIIKTNHLKYIVLPILMALMIFSIALSIETSSSVIDHLLSSDSEYVKTSLLLLIYGRPNVTTTTSFLDLIKNYHLFLDAIVLMFVFVFMAIDLFFDKNLKFYILICSIALFISNLRLEYPALIIVIASISILYCLYFEITTFKTSDKEKDKKILIPLLISFSFMMTMTLLSFVLMPDSYPDEYDAFTEYQKVSYDVLYRGYDNILPSSFHILLYLVPVALIYLLAKVLIKKETTNKAS